MHPTYLAFHNDRWPFSKKETANFLNRRIRYFLDIQWGKGRFALLRITEQREFASILQMNPSFLLFKHSLTCPVSGRAFQEFQQFVDAHSEIPAFYLAVQESRPLSDSIAETFSVKHETPQILFIRDGKLCWHASHWDIRQDRIERAVRE